MDATGTPTWALKGYSKENQESDQQESDNWLNLDCS